MPLLSAAGVFAGAEPLQDADRSLKSLLMSDTQKKEAVEWERASTNIAQEWRQLLGEFAET